MELNRLRGGFFVRTCPNKQFIDLDTHCWFVPGNLFRIHNKML